MEMGSSGWRLWPGKPLIWCWNLPCSPLNLPCFTKMSHWNCHSSPISLIFKVLFWLGWPPFPDHMFNKPEQHPCARSTTGSGESITGAVWTALFHQRKGDYINIKPKRVCSTIKNQGATILSWRVRKIFALIKQFPRLLGISLSRVRFPTCSQNTSETRKLNY